MTSQASKVRMVRCPKCRHLLAELVEVPIYQCGGCGAILQAKKRGKDLQGTGSQANEADSKHKNEVENTSENHITEESIVDEFPTRVDSTTDDRIESLGEIDTPSQLYGADAITCHEIEGSSTEATAHAEEEEGKLPLYQYGTADQDEDSENNDLNEILSFSELNQDESNSSVPQDHNHESESFLSSLEIRTQSQHSSSEFNCDRGKEVSENDSENASEKSSAGIETEISGSSEDNCDGGKKEFEDELQNTFENPSTDNEELEEDHAQGKSSADGMRESIGSVNPTSSHEIADLLLESLAPTEADKCEISHNQSSTEAHYNSEYDNEKSGEVSILNKALSSPKLNHLENDSSALGYHMYESSESLLSSPEKVTGNGYLSPNNSDEGKNEHPSEVEEVDENREGLLILTSANAETFVDDVTKDQIITADSFSGEGISSDNLTSSHRKMQQVEGGMIPGFQHVSSDDTLENTSHFYARGDLGVTLRSLTARKYYAYDDSASSHGTGDQVPDRLYQLSKGSSEDVGPSGTKVFPERSEYIMNRVTSNESELQRHLMNSGSSLQGKKYSTTKVSRWHQDELLVRARYRSPVRNRMRDETDHYHSRVLFSGYSSQADQRRSSSSNYGQKEFFALPDNPRELHRLELLRMVYELQDQLKKTQLSEGMPHGRLLTRPSKGKEHHFAENYSDLANHNYHGKYRRDITWLKNRELPRMVLPEDPIHHMHRVDCLCLRCCSQEQYHSAQQAPHAIYYSEEQSMTYARQTSRAYSSASSIPHHYETNDFSLWSQDMKSDDRWHNKHKEARIHHIAKRHFQPIAGGAPIVACYHCSEMLQLPAESLLFKRRCHQLKCGACSKVLKFSLENKIHVVQYDPIPRNPLPSVTADNPRVIKKSDLALAYRGSDHSLAEPAASSSNSQSFSRSYSTGDNFSATPTKNSSASFRSESKRESVYKNKSSVESFRSARSSFITPDSEHSSSESEVESPVPGSALHKLMGYSSIRRLVFQ